MRKAQNTCKTEKCKNEKAKGRNKCWKCIKREYRSRNPLKASFQNLRNNAKRRGHEFTITLEYFEQFCIETQYLVGKGRTKDGLTVDRDKDELGYIPGNLKVLKNKDNIGKENRRRKILRYDYQTKIAFYKNEPKVDKSDIPF